MHAQPSKRALRGRLALTGSVAWWLEGRMRNVDGDGFCIPKGSSRAAEYSDFLVKLTSHSLLLLAVSLAVRARTKCWYGQGSKVWGN